MMHPAAAIMLANGAEGFDISIGARFAKHVLGGCSGDAKATKISPKEDREEAEGVQHQAHLLNELDRAASRRVLAQYGLELVDDGNGKAHETLGAA